MYIWPKIKPNIYDNAYHLISIEKIEKPDVKPKEHCVSVNFKNWSIMIYLYRSLDKR